MTFSENSQAEEAISLKKGAHFRFSSYFQPFIFIAVQDFWTSNQKNAILAKKKHKLNSSFDTTSKCAGIGEERWHAAAGMTLTSLWNSMNIAISTAKQAHAPSGIRTEKSPSI
jgi:hypothetical protein